MPGHEDRSPAAPRRQRAERSDEGQTHGGRLRRSRHGESTRQKLITAAIAEFRERGYVRARVESITSQADVGYGTFYHYFSSKTDLIRQLADEVYGDLYQGAERQLDTTLPPAQRALTNLRIVFGAFARNREALLVLDDAVGADPAVAARVHELRTRYVNRYAQRYDSPVYHTVGPHPLISTLTAGLTMGAARLWLQGGISGTNPSTEADLDILARMATIMCLSISDPVALGIDPNVIEQIMQGTPQEARSPDPA